MERFSIKKYIIPITDSEDQLRRHILWLLFIRVVLFTLLPGISALLQSKGQTIPLPPTRIVLAFISLVYLYSIGSAIALQSSALRLRRFGLIQLLSDVFFAALLVYGTGCSQSIFTPVFNLPIIAGGLILYRIGGLIPASAATISYALILGLEHLGHLPPHLYTSQPPGLRELLASMNLFSVYGIIFFLTALLSGIIAGRLRSTEAALSETALQLDRISLLYERIFNDIHTGIITIDQDDRISSCNPAAEKITAYSASELIGTKIGKCFPEIIPGTSDRNVANLMKKDGQMTRVGYSFSRLHMSAKENSGPEADPETCERCKIVTIQDISKIEEMERKVIETENMAAIGRLSASIAHDFRNPLAAISGCAQMLEATHNDGATHDKDTGKRLIDIILRESQRMAKTITDFLQYSRPAPLKLEWCNLKRLLHEIIEKRLTSGQSHESCKVEIELEENLSIWADRQQLQTALLHLLDNGCGASVGSTDPVIVCAREDTWRGKGIILIEVMDKGSGIPEEIQGKIFDPFFSTREDGTGLGLAIVKHIIEHHHGSVEIFSIKDQGCTVQLRLPLPEESTTPEPS